MEEMRIVDLLRDDRVTLTDAQRGAAADYIDLLESRIDKLAEQIGELVGERHRASD